MVAEASGTGIFLPPLVASALFMVEFCAVLIWCRKSLASEQPAVVLLSDSKKEGAGWVGLHRKLLTNSLALSVLLSFTNK